MFELQVLIRVAKKLAGARRFSAEPPWSASAGL